MFKHFLNNNSKNKLLSAVSKESATDLVYGYALIRLLSIRKCKKKKEEKSFRWTTKFANGSKVPSCRLPSANPSTANSFLPSLARLEANCCSLPRFVAGWGWLLAGKEPSAQRSSAGFDFARLPRIAENRGLTEFALPTIVAANVFPRIVCD